MPDTDFWSSAGYDPSWGSAEPGGFAGAMSGGAAAPSASDTNAAGAAEDPFAYTNGSLLTPWTQVWDPSKFAVGGGGPAPFTAFNYAPMDFKPSLPGQFDETYQGPGNFTYGAYTPVASFTGITNKDLQADSGYQFRVQQGQKALEASKAAQGVLRTGGTAKALVKYGQDQGSQEYANVYQRKAAEHDRSAAENLTNYQTNRSNVAENFDRNTQNTLNAYNTRLNAYQTNANVQEQNANLGWTVASGEYDRNEALARQQYEDKRAYDNAVAAAGSAAANTTYDRALDAYKMAQDTFYTNQDRQYAILSAQDAAGRQAAAQYAGLSGGNATDAGNAAASGVVGSANAWSNTLGSLGNAATDYGLYAMMGSKGLPRPSRS